MKKQLLFLALGITLLSSCTKTTNNNDILPTPTGTFEGFVKLYDEFGNPLPLDSINNKHYAGVKVSLDSTGYSTTADSNGKFVFKGIPANADYSFTFKKPLYGTYNIVNVPLLVTGNAPDLATTQIQNVPLYKVSTTQVLSLLTPTVNPPARGVPGSITLTASLNNSNITTTNQAMGAVVFFSVKKNVSSTNYDGVINLGTTNTTPANISNNTPFYPSSNPYYVPVGTTLYFIAYGYSGNTYDTYTNTIYGNGLGVVNGITVYPTLNATPSAIESAQTE